MSGPTKRECPSGAIADGSTPLRVTDHWNRWRADAELMARLNLPHYRLGVEWSRIEPEPGRRDPGAIEH
ncbi:hypothetical protein CGZ93_00430 [Enemella dayhoffiae]|uniref:Uncharacterized protein n=1 Tax=Enemella dayhoffiae TaxID=2016507 RepID=A0A255HBN9_9ACTN|nr:family 1 glycosylhydrolase [Enemella dayhoffiae]OYO24977.1 hypothetical protein CGZ93_00430 [Enemella dayhoffiae]